MTDRKLIIFDFDGTLAEGHQGFVEALKEFSEARGLPYDGVKMGLGYIDPRKYDLGWGVSLEEQPQLLKEVNDFYDHETTTSRRFLPMPFAYTDAVLKELATGYDLAIITARYRGSLQATLDYYEWNGYFPAFRSLCCARERGYDVKPAPDAVHCLLRETGHKPERTVVIGDTTADIDMANNAKVKSIAVLWGTHPREKLAASHPTAIVANMADLPAAIDAVFTQ